MVITLLYTCTGTEIGTEIGTKIGTKIWRMEIREKPIHPDAYLSGLVGLVHFGLVHFGSVQFGLV